MAVGQRGGDFIVRQGGRPCCTSQPALKGTTMKALCIAAAGVLIAGLVVSLRAEEEKLDNKALIVGIWELTKVSEGPRDVNTMEFTKDGKFKMKLKGTDGKEFDVDGNYVVEGDK